MSSGSNRGLCDTVVDSQRTKFLKVSIRQVFLLSELTQKTFYLSLVVFFFCFDFLRNFVYL